MKRIVICGAGEVGRHAAEMMAGMNHSISLVDTSSSKLKDVEESIDIRLVRGNSCHPEVLEEAGASKCDLLIAATNKDEVNLLTAALAKKLGSKKVVARLHHRSYLNSTRLDYRDAFAIDHLICPEQLTSMAITAQMVEPGAMEIAHFAGNQIEVHRYVVKAQSRSAGQALKEIKLPKGVRIAVIRRGADFLSPEAETILREADIVTMIGVPEAFDNVRSLFDQPIPNRSVAIMGGTSISEWLIDDLVRKGFHLRLFEQNEDRAIELSERYPEITVIKADPAIPSEFRSEKLDQCSVFITASDDDEHNILASLQAKRLGVKTTAAIIHSPTFLKLLGNLGIDLPFSPRLVAARMLMDLVDDSQIRRLAILAPRTAVMYEVVKVVGGAGVGLPLREIKLPRGSFVAAIQRNDAVLVPGAQDSVIAGDKLIVIGPEAVRKNLHKLFLMAP